MADILREYRATFEQKCNPLKYHLRILNAIQKCRTSALGGHVERCDGCNHERIAYNSCRNRHCPKCQQSNTEKWIEARQEDLLECKYFHCVFTLPQALNIFCLHYPDKLYDILFSASKDTICTFGKDEKYLGSQMGAISILHTWGQNLQLHPHVHMIVPGGGIDHKGIWKSCKGNGKYLFPVMAMSRVFRGKFIYLFKLFMEASGMEITPELKADLYAKDWVVYAKRPFGGPEQVIEYLGRYTHKVAISNHRLQDISGGKVTFRYKDYTQAAKVKSMILDATEFLRRFCLHILPRGYRKIRHYGLMASRNKALLKSVQRQMKATVQEYRDYVPIEKGHKTKSTFEPPTCPCCQQGKMIRITSFNANAPPIIQTKLPR